MAATTALIQAHMPIAALVSIIDDYLCPADATYYQIGFCGHGERCVQLNEPDTWIGVCAVGHAELVKIMMTKYFSAVDLDMCVYKACKGGHSLVVELLVERDAAEWDQVLVYACHCGSISSAHLAIRNGASCSLNCLIRACQQGHSDLADLMISHGANPLRCTCRGGKHTHVIGIKGLRGG